jgi:hypothetical protein
MSDLSTAAQQALEALELAQTDVHWELNSPTRKFLRKSEKTLRAALAQQDEPQTLDEAMQQNRAIAQAYEAGYKAGAAHEREACAKVCEQYELARSSAAAIRARSNT